MRTNSSGVTEKAEFNIDRDKYGEGWDRVFGKKPTCERCKDKIVITIMPSGKETITECSCLARGLHD